MTLGEKQQLFTRCLVKLLTKAHELGYEIRMGEVWRPEFVAREYAKQGKGIINSVHILKLAADLNLFKDGVYLTSSEDHRELGEYWKTLHELCRWGGDFKNRDGNHYSMEHQGRK